MKSSMLPLLILSLLIPACAAQVGSEPGSLPEPSCSPGSGNVRILLTPESTYEVDEATAAEYQVAGCVEIPNDNGAGHAWCCWKTEAVSR